MKPNARLVIAVLVVSGCIGLSTLAAAGGYGGGSGTPQDPFLIRTPEQMNAIGADPNDWGKHFKLTADLDLSAYTGTQYRIIGNVLDRFTGTFDGNGHVIRNLTYSTQDAVSYVGLFGYASVATIRNLGLENVSIFTNGSFVGGLAGHKIGTISGCYVTGSVTGNWAVGGVVGNNEGGTVENCYSTASVVGMGSYAGGVVGRFWQGDTIGCYSTGTVTGNDYVGGFMGWSYYGILHTCFWDIEASGKTQGAGFGDTSGLTGKTTAEMKTRSTFTDGGWDFVGEADNGTVDRWRMCTDGAAYPRLAWEFSAGGDFACPDGVDLEDLNSLAERWMSSTPEGAGATDGNLDGKAGLEDLAVLSEGWLIGIFSFDPAAHWMMDDNEASMTVLEAGDGHYNGTAQRVTSEMTTAGRIGGALAFDGSGDWIDCGTEAALMPEAWTVCAWVRCAEATTPMLFSFSGNYPSIKLQNNGNGKPLIHLGKSNYRYFAASAWAALLDGQWHHVAFTVPGKGQTAIEQARMYLDGVAVAVDSTVASGPQNNKSHVYIGGNPAVETQRFSGTMDDVVLFGRSLSEAEIVRVMNRAP